MLATAKTLTWEEFEKLPDDGMHHELVEGELITLPPPKLGHGLIAKRIYRILETFEVSRSGLAFIEMGYKLFENPPTWVIPDVSFISAGRRRQTSENDFIHGAPELAVEVISPSESAAHIDQKVVLMLAAGARTIWMIYPRTQHVVVHQADGGLSQQKIGDVLAAEILPGFELPVERLFED